jgi:hypothetical protein
MTSNDPIAAVLDQLAAHHEQITRLCTREADHHAAVLARLEGLERQVAEMTVQLADLVPPAEDSNRYRTRPAPKWWKLTVAERREPVTQLRAWVDQVYRPGYGHLAATLEPCWETHDLCLYGLDILSQLWSVLYLQPHRTAGMLSAQAEYQARILPALAEQFMVETRRCGHGRIRTQGTGQPRSMP